MRKTDMDNEKSQNCYVQEYKPTTTERLWDFLGFRHPCIPNSHALANLEEPKFLVTDVGCYFTFLDRVRILISGRVKFLTTTETDVVVAHVKSTTAVGILPPKWNHNENRNRD